MYLYRPPPICTPLISPEGAESADHAISLVRRLLQAKNEDRVKVYANVSGLGGVMDSGHLMEMRGALVLISLAASEGVFCISGFKSAGSTVVPSHLSPADLAITKSHIR